MRFEELYKHELEQQERLRSALSLPLGLLVAIGSLLGIMFQTVWFEVGVVSFLFYTAVLGSAFFLSELFTF